MKLFVCEGMNDAIWIDEIRKNLDCRKPLIIDNDFQELQMIFGIERKYERIKKNYSFILFADSGKENVTDHIVPEIPNEVMGKIAEIINLFVLVFYAEKH